MALSDGLVRRLLTVADRHEEIVGLLADPDVAGDRTKLTELNREYAELKPTAGYFKDGRRWLMDMLPRLKDLTDIRDNVLYYGGIKEQPPEFDRFSYKQKMEYGALIVGNTLMAATGLLLWMEYLWSKFIVDIATIVHGMEAILACLALIVWHMYEIHLGPHKNPLNNMWLTGLMDEEELKAEHPLHYKKIMNDPALQKIYCKREAE